MGLKQRISTLLVEMKTWTWHHVFVFVLTFFAYAFFHGTRKSFSNVRSLVCETFTPNHQYYPIATWQREHMFSSVNEAAVFLGSLDSIFFSSYAVGLFINGVLGDRLNLRYFLSFGMFSSALMTFICGYMGAVLTVRDKFFYGILHFLNGLCQSIGWPSMVCIMGNWFGKSSSGIVFGVWSANALVGNIIGTMIQTRVMDYGYEFGILINSLILFCGGILIFVCLIAHPAEVGLHKNNNPSVATLPKRINDQEEEHIPNEIKIIEPQPIGLLEAVFIPGVIPYALAYECLKLVNYSFFFWLPTYLKQGLGWTDTQSTEFSNLYDVGGILGGIIIGLATDLMGVRSPVISVMLLLSVGTILLFNASNGAYTVTALILLLNGFVIGGVSNTIDAAITADLGKHEKLPGSAEAVATVTGIIDGTGSIGAAIGQYSVGVVNEMFAWQWVFMFLIIFPALSFLCVLPIVIDEMTIFISYMRMAPVVDNNLYQHLQTEEED